MNISRSILFGVALALMAPASQAATVVFDGSDRITSATSRNAGNAPLARFTFASSTEITSISAIVDPAADGNAKFVIFDDGVLDFETTVAVTGAGGYQSLTSGLMSYVFDTVSTYSVGTILDVASLHRYNSSTANAVQGDVTMLENNNVSSFATPAISGPGGAYIAVSLTGGEISAVPLPAGLVLLPFGIAALRLTRRRRTA